ncbi:MAG: HPP family protein [Phycisphaerae bacterium]
MPSWVRRLADAPEPIWSPVMAGALVLLAGLLSFLLRQPWLFPSLGPTAFIQAHRPSSRTATLYSTIAGHTLGIAAGFGCVFLTGAVGAPSVAAIDHAVRSRVAASALAVGITMLGQVLLRAYHPPAAATTLIISLGVLHVTWRDGLGLVIGILVVAFTGELLRRLRVAARNRPATGSNLEE